MRPVIAIALVLTLCGFTATEDDISGWEFTRSLPIDAPVHGVGVAQAPLPVRDGNTSIRFEVRPGDCSRGKHGWDDCKTDRERTELKQRDHQRQNETMWYAFSLHVPADHVNVWPAKLSFAQFHQEGGKPAIMLRNYKGGLWLDVRHEGKTMQLTQMLTAEQLRGHWNDITLNVHWSRHVNGYVRAWVGNRKVTEYRGSTMNRKKVYFKFGLYRSFVSRNPLNAKTTHTAYFDRVVRGRTHNPVGLKVK